MHFHLPKPLHGWREFAGEVGIIVIGVMIALGAEQLVEQIHERLVIAETREAIRGELETGLASLSLRKSAEPCIDRRLGEVRRIVDEWGATGSFQTPKYVGASPMIGLRLNRYDAASSAGRLAILSNDEQFKFGVIATGLRYFSDTQSNEQSEWAKIRELQSGPKVLSAGDRTLIRAALQQADFLNYELKNLMNIQLALAATYGLRPNFDAFRRRAYLTWKNGRFTPSICVAIDTPPEIAGATNVVASTG